MRAALCDEPGCTERMHGADDEELFRSVRAHADTAHRDRDYTDADLRQWLNTAAFNDSSDRQRGSGEGA